MTPLVRTLAGLAGGWLATRAFGLVEALQSNHGETRARKLSSRRSFTRNATLGAVGIVVAQITGAFGLLMWPNKTGAFGTAITVAAENVPEVMGDPFKWTPGKFYLVHTDDGIEALYWKCVHLGCTVPWISGQGEFICPCHGSVYEYNGSRVSGPAPRALDAMPVTVNDDGSVTVDTNPSSLIIRGEYTPADAVPYPA
jgi:cytochrome b6-f complex iron-sulfur subunit